MAKKKKIEANNPFKVPNEKADEVRGLSNDDLIIRTSMEYQNLRAAERIKKNDPELQRLKEEVATFRSEIKNNPEVMELEEQLKNKKKELVEEDQARLEEELRNQAQPFNEDIQSFRSVFMLAMDEINRRREMGVLKYQPQFKTTETVTEALERAKVAKAAQEVQQ
jgi:hypothetical protein